MDKIYVNSIKELIKYPIPIGVGTTARCYMAKDGNVIKKYKNNYDSIKLLNQPNFIENLEGINSISNEYIIGPKKLLYIDNKMSGYIYEYVKSNDICKINSSTKLSTLFKNFEIVLDNIKRISDENFLLQDIHGKNILFYKDIYYFIDLDRGYFTSAFDKDELYILNSRSVLNTVIDSIYKLKPWQDADYIGVDVNSYLYSKYIDIEVIKKLCDDYKNYCKEDDPTLKTIKKKTLSRSYFDYSY